MAFGALSAMTCDRRNAAGALRPHAGRERERERYGLWGFTLQFLCLRGGGGGVMPTKPQTLSPKQCGKLCLSKGDVENISSFENLIEG